MCNVCVAENALMASACGRTSCVGYQNGYQTAWTSAPVIDFKKAFRTMGRKKGPESRRRSWQVRTHIPLRIRARFFGLPERPTVYVRAHGRDPEGGGRFQLRREGEDWPTPWQTTDDLAGAMGTYGLDVKWKYVHKLVQDWALYLVVDMPTLETIEAALESRVARPLSGHRPQLVQRLLPKRRTRASLQRTKKHHARRRA